MTVLSKEKNIKFLLKQRVIEPKESNQMFRKHNILIAYHLNKLKSLSKVFIYQLFILILIILFLKF
jgi:hypothetical protein